MAATDITKGRAYKYPPLTLLLCLTLRKVLLNRNVSHLCKIKNVQASRVAPFFNLGSPIARKCPDFVLFLCKSSLLSTDKPFCQLLLKRADIAFF